MNAGNAHQTAVIAMPQDNAMAMNAVSDDLVKKPKRKRKKTLSPEIEGPAEEVKNSSTRYG